jgi:hypothetical protein
MKATLLSVPPKWLEKKEANKKKKGVAIANEK